MLRRLNPLWLSGLFPTKKEVELKEAKLSGLNPLWLSGLFPTVYDLSIESELDRYVSIPSDYRGSFLHKNEGANMINKVKKVSIPSDYRGSFLRADRVYALFASPQTVSIPSDYRGSFLLKVTDIDGIQLIPMSQSPLTIGALSYSPRVIAS